ncbi:MAG: UbiA prenyltransferase family protein [Candidatus Omnitrophica bacterium]|nr:UbiA prenyltransferase family protein [Candidatus Omnitrophota bacterium]
MSQIKIIKKESILFLIKQIIISMRPRQWIKNLCIFAAVIFTGNLRNLILLIRSSWAFVIFCGLSGAVYIINDIRDKYEDKNHPLKKERPIASGRLKIRPALISAVLITLVSLYLSFFLPLNFIISALIYFLLMLSYSLFLRQVIIIDVIIVSLGYVLRVLAGGFAISILSTPWSLMMTFFVAVFISFVKRKAEKITWEEKNSYRKNLRYYKRETLDYLIIISATIVIISYAQFAIFSGKNQNLYITIPFVLYGVFRYMYLAFEYNSGDEPSIIFIKDKPLFYNILLWILASVIIIYFT